MRVNPVNPIDTGLDADTSADHDRLTHGLLSLFSLLDRHNRIFRKNVRDQAG
jgi:hypothetical protein